MSPIGLDMYLTAEAYVSGYDFSARLEPVGAVGPFAFSEVKSEPAPPENVQRYRQLIDLAGLTSMADPNTPSATVAVTVAYWRKANQIHAWFVDNCQGGVDECQRSDVSIEQLRELRALAAEVAERVRAGEPEVATSSLAPRAGFFFGSTEIDDYYLDDLDDTVRQLDRVLNHPNVESFDFCYHASW